MIARITKAYIRRYSDNGQVTAYVEWTDGRGCTGRTEGTAQSRDFERVRRTDGGEPFHVDLHMDALLSRAVREGVPVTRETW